MAVSTTNSWYSAKQDISEFSKNVFLSHNYNLDVNVNTIKSHKLIITVKPMT